jgi:hypothetical protein
VVVTVIGSMIDTEARQEAGELKSAGRHVMMMKVPKDAMSHDRWFKIDDEWWHSGASLKDIGRKFSRISRVDEAESDAHAQMVASLLGSGTEVP